MKLVLRSSFLLFIFFVAAIPGYGQNSQHWMPELVGMIDVSNRYGGSEAWLDAVWNDNDPGQTYLYSSVEPISGRIGSATESLVEKRHLYAKNFELAETSYEYSEIVVIAKSTNWVKVQISGEPGWIKLSADDVYTPYLDLIKHRLNYATRATIDIAAYPGGELEQISVLPSMQGENTNRASWVPDVEVLDTETLTGKHGSLSHPSRSQWIKVRILSGSVCSDASDEPRRVLFEGWTPAYRDDGEVAVWFYPRGC